MANHSRFACFCLLLLSLFNGVVLGKIRGFNTATDNAFTLDASTTSDSAALRLLKHHNGMRKHKNNNNGKNKAKGAKEMETDEPEHHHPIDPESEYPHPHPEYPEPEHPIEPEPEPEHPIEPAPGKPKGGNKGGKETGESKGGKQKGGKYKSAKHKGGKNKGGKQKQKGQKTDKSDKGGKNKDKGSKKGGDYEDKSKGKSKKGGTGKYHGKAVEKKHKSYKGSSYVKSKNKLAKSSDGYETEVPTEFPIEIHDLTLVEVNVSFYFAFNDTEERRRLDGHSSYEPTPEEIATLDHAIKEYAIGLFDYLHEDKPDSFHSVTPMITQVVVHPGAPYPLRVDVTFHVLYNETPENAPTPAEVAEILEEAFTTEDFTYFYLWGRDDIWNNVTSVKVEAIIPEDTIEPSPAEPDVAVLATMIYDFSTDPTTEPTEEDFDQLTSLTQSFFTDLLTDLYKDDPDTDFEELVVTRQATTYDIEATPPVIVDFAFLAKFDEDSMIIPSSDDLFDIMAGNVFDDYIRLYLSPCNCFWSPVNRVGLLELSAPETGAPSGGELIPPQSALAVQSSVIHSFFGGMASRPSKEDYTKLEMATSVFFNETLTEFYMNKTETTVLMSSTEIESSFYSEDGEEPLQVDYSTSVLFEGVGPDDEEVFSVLEGANFERYIMEFLWPEGEPWNNINGVMLLDRIPPPPSS